MAVIEDGIKQLKSVLLLHATQKVVGIFELVYLTVDLFIIILIEV